MRKLTNESDNNGSVFDMYVHLKDQVNFLLFEEKPKQK